MLLFFSSLRRKNYTYHIWPKINKATGVKSFTDGHFHQCKSRDACPAATSARHVKVHSTTPIANY